jgi:hypothetical protein
MPVKSPVLASKTWLVATPLPAVCWMRIVLRESTVQRSKRV